MCKMEIVSIGKACVSVFALWIFCVLFLSACDTEKGAGAAKMEEGITETAEWTGTAETEEETGTTETAGDISETLTEVQKEPVGETESEKIPIDYPFPGVVKGYTLALVTSNEQEGRYDLQVCDESGTVVQQFPCGMLAEPVTFRYDDLDYDAHPDLEIFSADSQSGILFSFNRGYSADMAGSKVFLEEAIEIPDYDEIRGRHMLVCTEDDEWVEKTIYQLNMHPKRMDEIRLWRARKDTEMLTIWDYLEQKMIFEGQTKLDEAGEPLNAEYYNYLLWDHIYLLSDYEESGKIPVWVSEPLEETDEREENGFEYMQNVFFGNPGHMEEYTDRQPLLVDFGFGDQNPAYQCYDCFGNLSLELYMNELSGNALGIVHKYYFTKDMKKIEYLYGFSIDHIWEGEWEEPDPFDMKSVEGSDGADQVEEYEEILEYREDGQPDFFWSGGYMTWLKDGTDGEKDTLVQIDFIYRDDGTLCYRDYQHSSFAFNTTFCSKDSFYDEDGRILYEDGYITHGSLLYYYFYDSDGRKPKYCLQLDENLGYYIPTMVRYR